MRSLEFVDFVDSQDRPLDGLVPVRDRASANGAHERAILLQAADFKQVAFVFFRRFKDDEGRNVRSSQVAAYVVDNSRQRLTEDDVAKLHRSLWLHGVAPLVYVAWPTRVDILSCAREPDFWDVREDEAAIRYRPAAQIHVAEESATDTGTDPVSGSPTGGIQRFKLGLHGSDVPAAAMVGYIQKQSPDHWHRSINGWIGDLIGVTSMDGCVWSQADRLQFLQTHDDSQTAFSVSVHLRHQECVSRGIEIHHLWVVMNS